MDLSFTLIPNIEGILVKILREPLKSAHVNKFQNRGIEFIMWMKFSGEYSLSCG
jgi:hypothetical protein